MEFAGDPEAVARDEDTIEDDRRAARVVRDALGLERRLAGPTAEVARLAPAEAYRRDAFMGAGNDDAQLEFEDLVQRRQREIGTHHLVAERRGQERALQAHRVSVDQTEPFEDEHPRATGEAKRLCDAAVRRREPRAQEPGRDVL